MRAWLLGMLLVANSGCALLASANVHHNSRGSACVSTPAFGLVDIVIAGVSAAAIGATEASAGYYAVPAVFGASGLLGVVSAARCRGEDDSAEAATATIPSPPRTSDPSLGDAPVDPEAEDATAEDVFGTTPVAPPPVLDRNGIPRVLPPPPAVTQEPAPRPAPVPPEPTCALSPRRDCPEGFYCKLVAENAGECVKMH